MKTLFKLIIYLPIITIGAACNQVTEPDNIKTINEVQVQHENTKPEIVTIGSNDDFKGILDSLYLIGGMDQIISWSKENLKRNNIIKFTKGQAGPSEDETIRVSNVLIIKLDGQGNETNQYFYESSESINHDISDVYLSIRENFKGINNYNFILYKYL